MQPWQTVVVVIVAVILVSGVFWCMLRAGADEDRAREAIAPKHKYSGREAPPPLLVAELDNGGVQVMTAWEEAIMPGELYRRARQGNHPQIAYAHDETGDLITFGPYGERVVYRLGGMHPKIRDTYYVVRVA